MKGKKTLFKWNNVKKPEPEKTDISNCWVASDDL
jgi:hypothetical protein